MARILVVEDHRIIAWNIQESLESLGHDVIGCVASGADALKLVQQENLDLILMDVRLDGEIDGIQTAATIQQQVRVPIVYLTAHVEPQTIQRAIATRPYGYLLKPIHLPELHTAVEMALHRYQLEQALRDSEEQLRQIVDGIEDTFFLKDSKSGQLIYVNPAWETIFQCPRQELYDHPQRWLELIHPDDRDRVLQQIQSQEQAHFSDMEYRIVRPDGSVRWIWDRAFPIYNDAGEIYRYAGVNRDITEQKQAIEALQTSETQFRQFAEYSQDVIWVFDPTAHQMLYISPAYERIWGRSSRSLYEDSSSFLNAIHPDDRPRIQTNFQQFRAGIIERYHAEYRIVQPSGDIRWILDRGFALKNDKGEIYRFVGNAQDITASKMFQLSLEQQIEQEQLLSRISQHIRQSLELQEILDTTVAEIRHILSADRVVIYQFDVDWSGTVIAESVTAPWTAMKGREIFDPCLSLEDCLVPYQQGQVSSIANIHEAGLKTCYVDLLNQFQVKANLVIPILESEQLWGLLAVQNCASTRHWQGWEIKLLRQLSDQLSIAIQQAELYQQVQQFNITLEQQVYQRTIQLQQAAQFEETLKRITDKVRDSLDEAQILQTAVRELAIALSADACDAGLYDWEQQTSTVAYAYVRGEMPNLQGQVINMSQFPHLYQQLKQGNYLHYCPTESTRRLRAGVYRVSTLACPLQDVDSIVGDLWIHRQTDTYFNEAEIRLVQQVANQCAIALRQARLYEASRTQIDELERLNLLKDDFLSTVSHELRTPISSIQMATQMLEVVISRESNFAAADHPVHRYLAILREECRRETNLINDLLDLSRLEAETEPLQLTTMTLQHWIPYVLESFMNQAHGRNQQFTVDIADDLPPLTTDFSYLERIVEELIDNACKYTPPGEEIRLMVASGATHLHIRVSNTGIEIPLTERDRIFDKFYRIPNHDPWKHGGTGLGLALIRRMVHYLGGTIQLESMANPVTFRVDLPLTLEIDRQRPG